MNNLLVAVAVVGVVILFVNEFVNFLVYGVPWTVMDEDYLLNQIRGTETELMDSESISTHDGFFATTSTSIFSKYYYCDFPGSRAVSRIPRWSRVHREVEKTHQRLLQLENA